MAEKKESGGGFNFTGAPPGVGKFNFSAMPSTPTPSTTAATSKAPPVVLDDSKFIHKPNLEASKFTQMYKNKGLKEATRDRIRDQLDLQKASRFDFMTHVRKITDLFTEDEDDELIHEAEMEGADENRIQILTERKAKRSERKKDLWRFKNQLMHSEWLLEKPEDFHENWVMVPIPQGKRNMVIASGGITTTYSKSGMMVTQFNSHLPGGGRHKHKWNMETAILDCVFNDVTKTFYIMDMMCWRQTPMYDTETQFRFYWLHEKFLEVPEVARISKQNQFRFEPLPNFQCTQENISNVLSCEMSVPLDGLLFYHKMTHYHFGFTPLVLWLRPFMIPEALGIMVHQKYIDRAPPDYRGFQRHREQIIENMAFRDLQEQAKKSKANEKRNQKKREKEEAISQGRPVTALTHTRFISGGNLQQVETMDT